jgi:hypothetical protein
MNPEDITPYALETFELLKKEIPSEISSRLTCSRSVRRHGSARTVYLFNVWDRNQKDLFAKNHFCYCLGYDPMHIYSSSTWYLHLWMNTVRIYQHSGIIRRSLADIISKQCPPPFKSAVDERSVQAVYRSPFMGELDRFQEHFLAHYVQLVGTLHPYLMPIIDSFTYSLTSKEREEVILARKKFYFGPRKRLSSEEIRAYSRSIPPSWRIQLLGKAKNRCVHCGTNVDLASVHIDHIKPFSKGGLTILENLQALCADCNLTKGNRLSF